MPVSGLAAYPGWGALPNSVAYDPAQAAYYPAARNKFGFYDNLAGIAAGPGVTVSYTVIGWYSSSAADPIASSSSPLALLKQWNLAWHPSTHTVQTPVLAVATAAPPSWIPPSLNVAQPASNLTVALNLTTAQPASNTQTNPQATLIREKSTALKNILSFTPAAGSLIDQVGAGLLIDWLVPSGTVCHGSVFAVQTAPAAASLALPVTQIQAHPSIKRAMAAVSNGTANGQQLDYAEMMLQNLDSQSGNTAGVLDLPGAAQSLSLQGVPGKSAWFANLEIGPPAPILLL